MHIRNVTALSAAAALSSAALAFVAPPAQAHEIAPPGTCSSGLLCFWKDADYVTPKGQFAGANNQWSAFAQPACPQLNWNDCASSIQNRTSRVVRVFKNTYQQASGGYLDLPVGQYYAHLGGINWTNVSGQVGDNISSNS